jgi:hypothetical protein
MVKALFFLTDVAADAGPFVYVPGSHRLTPERIEWERQMSLVARGPTTTRRKKGPSVLCRMLSERWDFRSLGGLLYWRTR